MPLIIDDYSCTITYTCENGPLAGLELVRGHVIDHPQAGRAVEFATASQSQEVRRRVKDRKIVARCEGKPVLAALADEYEAHRAEQMRQAREKAARAREKDEALLSSMREELAEIVARIPADHVRVTERRVGDLDGYGIYRYEAEGVQLDRDQITHHGTAFAIRDGALNSFASESVYSISRADLEAARAKTARQERDAAAEKEAREQGRREKFAEAARTGQKVELARWVEGCCETDSDFECSCDVVIEYALPDGGTERERIHTH